jgi:hypothetical protein
VNVFFLTGLLQLYQSLRSLIRDVLLHMRKQTQIVFGAYFSVCRLVKLNLLTVQCGKWVLEWLDEYHGGASVAATLAVTQHYVLLLSLTFRRDEKHIRQTGKQKGGPLYLPSRHQAPGQLEGGGRRTECVCIWSFEKNIRFEVLSAMIMKISVLLDVVLFR